MKLPLSYYLSRLILALFFGVLFLVMGASWWYAGGVAVLITLVAWFRTPESGRYVVNSEKGVRALQRDERTQQIVDKASRNGFIGLNLIFLGIIVYAKIAEIDSIPTFIIALIIGAGFGVYLISDIILRG